MCGTAEAEELVPFCKSNAAHLLNHLKIHHKLHDL